MTSRQTVGVRYAGKPLAAGARAFWRVQVWDENGVASARSAIQSWGAGLLHESDWKAQWISAQTPRDTNADGLTLPPPPMLRREFALDKPVARATLFATARGVYEMHLNGAKVGDQMMAPGWTDYARRVQYQAYDVTSRLRRGLNALGAIVGDGWFCGYLGYARARNNYGDTPALRAQLCVDFADGTRKIVGTNASWQGNVGPIVYSDMLMGEKFDARITRAGWNAPGFAARQWSAAVLAPAALPGKIVDVTEPLQKRVANGALTVQASNDLAGDPAFNTVKELEVQYTRGGVAGTRRVGEGQTLTIEGQGALKITRALYGDLQAPRGPAQLVGTRDPAVRVTQQIKPVKMTRSAPGVYIVDMGQNMVGVARLRVAGAAGTQVQLRFGEMLNPDGSLYTANLRSARATDTYICRGAGVETWNPRFTFHGFRFVEITGFPGEPTLDAITGLVIGSDIPQTGTFECSSPLVNQLQRNIDWGQRGNFLSVPTDCPQRDERLGWMGDAQIFARTATYNRDVAAFYSKWLQDVEDAQAPDGGFPDVAPRMVDLNNGAPAWGDAGIIVPWTTYQAYGDREVINRHWNAMERWMNYVTRANPDGLWLNRRANDFGDWLSIGADTPKDVLATAYYAYDAHLMAQMARATGRVQAADRYDALFDRIKTAFNNAFVTADSRVKGETQTAYLVALHFDLLPQNGRAAAANRLVNDIRAKGNHLSTGFIGVGYLCPTLTATGHNDVAYQLLLQDTFPSWGFSIRQGATTIWERWDGWTPDKGFQDVGMNSFNHYSLGSVGQWLFSDVAGIATDPAYPGFERVIIHPQPGPGLTFARATYDSVRGRIVSDWKQSPGAFSLRVTIPANAAATVTLPAHAGARIKESGAPIERVAGVRFVERRENEAVYQVGSGTYQFVVSER